MQLSAPSKIIPKYSSLYTVYYYDDDGGTVLAGRAETELPNIPLAVLNLTASDFRADVEGKLSKNDVKVYQLLPTDPFQLAFYPLSAQSRFTWKGDVYEIQPTNERPFGDFIMYMARKKNAIT